MMFRVYSYWAIREREEKVEIYPEDMDL